MTFDYDDGDGNRKQEDERHRGLFRRFTVNNSRQRLFKREHHRDRTPSGVSASALGSVSDDRWYRDADQP